MSFWLGEERNIKNRDNAVANKIFFATRKISAISLIGGSGSGKTELLRRTHEILGGRLGLEVILGSPGSDIDCAKLSAVGIPTYQAPCNTQGFLEAETVKKVIEELDLKSESILFIENPGNLFSPVGFDLGESCRILVHSVPEGNDKPLKYPELFSSIDLILVNKTDLVAFTDFSWSRFQTNLKKVDGAGAGSRRHKADVIGISCRNGLGLTDWRRWLLQFCGKETSESSSSLQKSYNGHQISGFK